MLVVHIVDVSARAEWHAFLSPLVIYQTKIRRQLNRMSRASHVRRSNVLTRRGQSIRMGSSRKVPFLNIMNFSYNYGLPELRHLMFRLLSHGESAVVDFIRFESHGFHASIF